MSIKILHINFSDSGGAAIASMYLHEELLRQGVESKYLCLNLTKKHPPHLHYYSHRRIYKTFIRKLWHLYLKGYLINKKYEHLHRLIPHPNDAITIPYSPFDLTLDPLYQEADIIHLHWPSRFLNWPTFFRKNRKPIVWTLHDRNPFSGILHCATNFPQEGMRLEEKIKKKKKKWLANANIYVVGPSELYTSLSQQSDVLGMFPHTTIYHGIPDQIFHPMDKIACRIKLNLPVDQKIILSVASDLKRKLKGFEELLRFAAQQPELLFAFIGKKDPLAPELSNVRYAGEIKDQKELNEWYNAADLTISNSAEESFGLTIAESLMAGTPIASRETGFIRNKIYNLIKFNELNEVKDLILVDTKTNLDLRKFQLSSCYTNYASVYFQLINKL